MSRRMSCSLTADAVIERRKTVTRRALGTWRNLAPGDRLTLVRQAMGLPKGAKQEVLAEVEIVSVIDTPLDAITPADIEAEGIELHRSPALWVEWFIEHHPGKISAHSWVRRIEWRYLDDAELAT